MSALPDYAEALERALRAAAPLGDTEVVDLACATGRTLRESITADRDLPPFNRAQMDGYALRAAELGRRSAWPVAGTIAAGHSAQMSVPPGQCVAIATGAPLPHDVDTVIQHELSDRGDPVHFTTDAIEPGNAVHPRGSDAVAGTTVLEPGTVLGPCHLGIAATVGRDRLRVARRPRAIVLTSGDEVRGAGEAPASHEIRNSNGPQTMDLMRRFGAEPIDHRHVRDDREDTASAVSAALAACDVLVTTGGISVGDRDHFPAAFDALGVDLVLVGAAIQPGRPVVVGRGPGGVVVAGLPGNPVSALACACLFVEPLVRTLLGAVPTLPWVWAELAEPVAANPRRRAFRPACLDRDGRIRVPRWSGSGDLAHTAATSGLAELPVQAPEVAAGTRVRFLRWP